MILKPLFQKFRNSEVVQFFIDALGICKQQKAETLQLTVQTGNLEKKATELETVFKITQGSSITEKLTELDRRRDGNLIGIHKYAEGLVYHFEQATKEAALAILNSFDKYGKNLYMLNYQAETSTITSLTSDWGTDSKLAAAVIKINLTAWAEELKTSNNLFNEMFLSRAGEKATANDIKFLELRKSAMSGFRELVQNIEARATLSTDNSYDALINALNALIQKYNVVAASHTNKKEDKPAPPKA
ncbi:MAG TPA: DUF6261 family protein [Bacteroidales bacterium]